MTTGEITRYSVDRFSHSMSVSPLHLPFPKHERKSTRQPDQRKGKASVLSFFDWIQSMETDNEKKKKRRACVIQCCVLQAGNGYVSWNEVKSKADQSDQTASPTAHYSFTSEMYRPPLCQFFVQLGHCGVVVDVFLVCSSAGYLFSRVFFVILERGATVATR